MNEEFKMMNAKLKTQDAAFDFLNFEFCILN